MPKRPKPPPESAKQADSSVNPANYPLGDLPAMTTEALREIERKVAQGHLLTKQEVAGAQSEARRALEKIEVMTVSTRPDAGERVISATATVRATFSLDMLAVVGRDHREQQRTKASRPRSSNSQYLNAAILAELNKQPAATAAEIWDALSQYAEDDLTIVEEKDKNKDKDKDRLRWHYHGDPECKGPITRKTFRTRVSRLKHPHG